VCLAEQASVSDGAATLELTANQRVSPRKGAKLASLKPEAGAAPKWADALLPRERLLYCATFEKDADGWDEEGRVSPGFGSSFALEAVASEPGKPWYFLANRLKPVLDPATTLIRFRVKTPVPDDALRIQVSLRGSRQSLNAEVVPRTNEWTLVEVRLAAMRREEGSLPDAGLGDDRNAKLVITEGEETDTTLAKFRIDDVEVVELLR
jgi:hypothetical protein